ncbi:Tyrosine recombinase XerD [Faecalibacterium prausnitzii]|jgi:integrase|nr:Tyrosine recombinase XerD [Faecalibacterium prausnitzii]
MASLRTECDVVDCIRCSRPLPEGALFCPWCGKRQTAVAPPPQRKRRRRPKGSGTVYLKKDHLRANPWVAKTGRGEILGSYASSTEATLALDDYNARHTSAARLRYTFADVYAKWKDVHFQDVGPKGQYSYEQAYAKAASLYDREMRQLKTEDYQQVITTLAENGLSRSSCEKQRQLFSQLCKWAMQNDIISINYAEGLRLPSASPKKERTLTRAEIQRIQTVADDPAPANRLRLTAQIALVLVYTGMRIDELLSMRRDDVHLDQGYLVGGEKTEAGRQRIIPILAPIRHILAGWMLDSIGSVYLLPTSAGRKKDINAVEHSFRRLMELCGINTKDTPKEQRVTPHSLRRTAATRLVEGKADPTAVQAILGHADFTTTANYYTVHDAAYLAEEMQKFKI